MTVLRFAPRLMGRKPLGLLAFMAVLVVAIGVLAEPAHAVGAPGAIPYTDAIADPGVALGNGTFYAMYTEYGLQEGQATSSGGPWTPVDVQATNFSSSWFKSNVGFFAPDLVKLPNGSYVAYFSAEPNSAYLAGTRVTTRTDPTTHQQFPLAADARCIGTATAPGPTGPFTYQAKPLVCQTADAQDHFEDSSGHYYDGAGVIDPSASYVNAKGAQWLALTYKTAKLPATIRMLRLNPDNGINVLDSVQESHELVYDTDTILESPVLRWEDGHLILFVSRGRYDACAWGTGGYSTWYYTTSDSSPWGWANPATILFNQNNTGICAPGGADVTNSNVSGQDRIFLAGWVCSGRYDVTGPACSTAGLENAKPACQDGNPDTPCLAHRQMYVAALTWDGYTPVVGDWL